MSCSWVASPLMAQAPPSANLWRVAAASLTSPAALAQGATAVFWNPAAAEPTRLSVGVQVIETSEVLGLRGIVGAVTTSLGPRVQLGVVAGRMDIRDLVRTTSSPISTGGSIPVYDQMIGGRVRVTLAGLELGGLVRAHDSRFDALREGGVTMDLGVRYRPFPHVQVAAATHFLPVDLSERENTDYYFGAEYAFTDAVSVAGLPTTILGRYGLSVRPTGDVEHALGAGAGFGSHVFVDGFVVRESAFGDVAWRPAFGIDIVIGRYAITFARSVGINDVGGIFRIGLDVDFIR